MDFGPTTQQFDPPPINEALPAGTRLGGYQIIDVLGRGGFGIVYLALDSSLQRQVAIKEYLPADLAMRCDDLQVWVRPGASAAAYASGMEAFLYEAKLLARFDHPALVRVHSVWEENRTAYMVMPYYAGLTLTATLKAMERPPNEAWLRALLTPLLGALGVLHTAQFLHLDVSPDNILVLGDGRPVLLDFGVANRMASDKTVPLTALLNPAYAPIEQYSESKTLPQGAWSDLYALAGVLHFAITGQPPARATVRAMDDPQRPLAETVRALQAKYPGLEYSESFLAGIDKALSLKPSARPRDVKDFLACLDRPLAKSTKREVPSEFFPTHLHTSSQAPTPKAAQPFAEAPWPAPASGPRKEPAFDPSPRHDWGNDKSSRDSGARRRTTSAWIGGSLVLALAIAAGVWIQRQAPRALITSADLPPGVMMAPAPRPTQPADAPPDPAAAALTQPPALGVPSAPPATMEGVVASSPLPTAEPAPEPPPVAATKASPPPTVTRKPAERPPVATVAAAPAEPGNPRAVCGSRANFALVYCMETQCKRPKFSSHPQCIQFKRSGEVN